ncbi:MAG: helix-turn-helix transcriptional regulator, partial [Nannocystaceae bacterium]
MTDVPSPEELRARIAARLREQAKRRHMTLAQLSESAGVSRTHLWNLTTGRAAVTVDVLAKLGA